MGRMDPFDGSELCNAIEVGDDDNDTDDGDITITLGRFVFFSTVIDTASNISPLTTAGKEAVGRG